MAFTRIAHALVACALAGTSAAAQVESDQDSKAYRPNTVTRGGPEQAAQGPSAGLPTDIALAYLRGHRQELGLTEADLQDVIVTSTSTSAYSGVTHVYLRQRYQSIDVYGAEANVNIARDGSVLNAGSSFFAELAQAVRGSTPARGAVEAAAAAARSAGLETQGGIEVQEIRGGPAQYTVLTSGGISRTPITARLVYQPVGPREVRLAWHVEIEELSGEHWWSMTVDAENAEVLAQDDYVVKDFWGAPPEVSSGGAATAPETIFFARGTASPPPNGHGASYRVFAHPKESPNDGGRTLVFDPANPVASPFGWHDTDGVFGPEFTVTRGNNVHAYTDTDANNVADPGSDPDGGASLTFDFTLDPTQNASTYRPAAVTNLFYWNNVIHDVFYQYGFDEAAGNFQVNLYGRDAPACMACPAPLGNDDVRAEAQDGSGTNNANFGTPVDGARPRMQMFIWTHPRPNSVVVNGGPAAGDYQASGASFGPSLATTGPITANVVLVNDGVAGVPVPPAAPGTVNDGCEPFVIPAGTIALLERGFCNFTVKVFNAQTAGAVAVIVANNVPGNPITMGFTPPIPTITIPSVMVSLDNATLFRNNLPLNATIRLDPTRSVTRDSDLDAGVITHEYGHGISNRLTGGPATVSCLNNQEQMGEGWSDWLALALTALPSDTRHVTRGVGNYLIFEPRSGGGIRPTAYSPDQSINPSTYDTIKTAAVPHGVGYVWATMLWDMYWNLADKHGFNPNVNECWATGGNNLAIQLVMDGMKLQPCRPGFVDGRNAILLADEQLTGGENQCSIWRAFARRGLGFSANQGLNTSRADGTQAFDMPASCGFGSPVDPGSVNHERAGRAIPLKFTLEGDEGLDIFATGYPASQPIDCTTLLPTGALEPTETSGHSGLTFNHRTGKYQYVWKTDSAWAGTCREVIVKLKDGTEFRARFSFR